MAGTQLAAPFDGTVLKNAVKPGDTIGATTAILTLADMEQLEVLASVDETTIRRVIGADGADACSMRCRADVGGQVGEVPLQGSLQGGVMVYEVPISLAGAEKLAVVGGNDGEREDSDGAGAECVVDPAWRCRR